MDILDTYVFKNLSEDQKEVVKSMLSTRTKKTDNDNILHMMMLSMMNTKTNTSKLIKLSCSALKTEFGDFSFNVEGTSDEINKLVEPYIEGIVEGIVKVQVDSQKLKKHWWSRK